jgi:hypothetical protein
MIEGFSHPLMEDDHLVTAVSPGAHLRDGEFRLAFQSGDASIEQPYRGGGVGAGANAISNVDQVPAGGYLADLVPARDDLYDAVRLDQDRLLIDYPVKPHESEQAKGECHQEQGYQKGWLKRRLKVGDDPGV